MSETLTDEVALSLWKKALKTELGVKVPIEQKDIDKIRATMYRARKEAADPSLDVLRLITAPGGTEVWIMKITTELP